MWLCAARRGASVNPGARRIMRLDDLSIVVRRSRVFRRIVGLDEPDELPKFVYDTGLRNLEQATLVTHDMSLRDATTSEHVKGQQNNTQEKFDVFHHKMV